MVLTEARITAIVGRKLEPNEMPCGAYSPAVCYDGCCHGCTTPKAGIAAEWEVRHRGRVALRKLRQAIWLYRNRKAIYKAPPVGMQEKVWD